MGSIKVIDAATNVESAAVTGPRPASGRPPFQPWLDDFAEGTSDHAAIEILLFTFNFVACRLTRQTTGRGANSTGLQGAIAL
jgi:hypothetical protein